MDAVTGLYEEIVNSKLLIRRVNLVANHVVAEQFEEDNLQVEQLDLFTDYTALEKQREEENAVREKEKKIQHAMLNIKKKYGKNAILKGMNLQEGATTRDRNNQIGGHKA